MKAFDTDILTEVLILSHSQQAEEQLQNWRKNKVKGSTHDLRIAASSATLVTRNRRDFEKIPGFSVEFWG